MKPKKILVSIALCAIIGITLGLYITERNRNRIILATTTSTYDSGLLDYILPYFINETGIEVDILAVGTGQALEIGRRGDADVLLVHSRVDEDNFINEGYGVHRVCVMYNDFIIIGPASDPANITNCSVTEAFNRIRQKGELGQALFYSRGDNSGTNKRELEIWNKTGAIPDSSTNFWYKETGAGMGNTLIIASDNSGYTLTDRGTYLSYEGDLNLVPLVEGDSLLLNPYGAILINPDRFSGVKFEEARKFVAFLVSQEGQELIGNFTKSGSILFYPLFGHCSAIIGCGTENEEIAYWSQYNGNYTG
ncbi:MAG: substrate-binding domain-containing protein [Promethearchaeota archaeon]